MHILITGGAGFIGSNFIKYLLNKYNFTLTNYDKLTYAGNLENLFDIQEHPGYCFIKGDIADKNALADIFTSNKIDIIINFAAESHVDRSIDDSGVFFRTNIEGARVLLETARRYGIKKFIQVSTDEVYGSLGSSGYFTEESPFDPSSPYSVSKAAADMLALAYYRTYGLPVIITRCSNNYGPFQFPEKLIPLMITNALEDKPLPVYGDGLNVRDWLHVWDHCRALDLILQQGRAGEVYNIGGHNEWTNIEIVHMILAALDKPDSLITFVKDRPGHDWRYAIDFSKLNQELGWSPAESFSTGLEKTVKWYMANSEWTISVRSGEYLKWIEEHYGK